jgi:hypothetical protein
MVKGETVQEWCHHVISLSNALKENKPERDLTDLQICRYMIKGLPPVLKNDAWAISAAKSDPHDIQETILCAIETMAMENEDKPLAESVLVAAAAVAAVPTAGGHALGLLQALELHLAQELYQGLDRDYLLVARPFLAPFNNNIGGRGRGSGRGKRPKELNMSLLQAEGSLHE